MTPGSGRLDLARLLLVAGLLALCPAPGLGAQDEPGGSVRGVLAGKLDRGIRGDRRHEVFVRMGDQLFVGAVDYPEFCRQNAHRKRDDLRRQVVGDLKRRADASWRQIEETVAALLERGAVERVHRYFVVNGFGCTATTAACEELARRPEVAFIYRKPVPRLPPVAATPNDSAASPEDPRLKKALELWDSHARLPFDPEGVTPTWNLERIQAEQVWRQERVTGDGITIALLDSGIHLTAPLIAALWRNPKEQLNGLDDDANGYVDDVFGWDFQARSNRVVGDTNGHGSMCGGIMAGRPVAVGDDRIVTGIAPGARLMVLRGMGRIPAYEYALENGADVLSMSYMWVNLPLGNWRGLYRLCHEHMTAAGIVSVGGAGNFAQRAPPGKQIALPKDIPCVVAAAGLDASMKKAGASSEGPCYWDDVVFYNDYPKGDPLAKPDVTGFFTGYPVWVHFAGRRIPARRQENVVHRGADGYGLLIGPGGNSFSGPHAGGVAALMMSANPELPAFQVIERMIATCRDLGVEGHDTIYGAGLLQALDAVRAARRVRAGPPHGEKREK